jgi:hypothetical protein
MWWTRVYTNKKVEYSFATIHKNGVYAQEQL